MERYTCPRELLPVIEAGLAAEGYEIAAPLQRAVGGKRITVMTRGVVVISLHEDVRRDTADITVHVSAGMGGIAVLEALPRLCSPHGSSARSAGRAASAASPAPSEGDGRAGEAGDGRPNG